MSNAIAVDLFATKGVEYLLVIGFLLSLLVFWRILNRATPQPSLARAPGAWRLPGSWFELSREAYYHPGHAWAMPAEGGRVRVGLDDFAQKLLGRPDAVSLPGVGDQVEQGGRGWTLSFGSRSIDMLSPVEGTVVARNDAILADPGILNREPHGAGWLFEVEAPRLVRNLNNLLRGPLAGSWMEATERALRTRVAGEAGALLQDGGVPVSGMARAISPEDWEEIAREFLMTDRDTA